MTAIITSFRDDSIQTRLKNRAKARIESTKTIHRKYLNLIRDTWL